MTCLFLLDRGKHSLSFSTHPDPTSVIWLDFEMLNLPSIKFGDINSIPWDELYAHIKTDIKAVKRVLSEGHYDTIVSSGRACLIHSELVDEGYWRGQNIFVDVSGTDHMTISKLKKHNSMFIESSESSSEKSEIRRAKKRGIYVCDTSTMPVQSHKISEFIQDFF